MLKDLIILKNAIDENEFIRNYVKLCGYEGSVIFSIKVDTSSFHIGDLAVNIIPRDVDRNHCLLFKLWLVIYGVGVVWEWDVQRGFADSIYNI